MKLPVPYKKLPILYLLLCGMAEMVKAFLFVLIPVYLGAFIDALIRDTMPLKYFLLLSGTAGGYLIFSLFVRYSVQKYGRSKERELRRDLQNHFCRMPLLKIDGCANGELMMKFFRDAESYGRYLHSFIPQCLTAVCSVVAAMIMVFSKSPLIAIFYAALFPLLFVLLFPYRKLFARLNHAVRHLYDRTLNRLFEFTHIFPFLKSMSAEAPYCRTAAKRFDHIRDINWKNDCGLLSFETANRLVLYVGEYGILAVAGYCAWKKIIPVGDVVVFQVLFLSVLTSVTGLFQLLPSWEMIRESNRSLEEMFSIPCVSEHAGAIPFTETVKTVELRRVTFHYDENRPLFQNYSCLLQRGVITAISGVNGSGKTTLLRLLTGYLEPQEGVVFVNGRNLKDWQLDSFRCRVSAVFQDSLLITGTIRENITLNNPKYRKSDIESALQLSGADSLVARLPDGLEHKIGVEGGGLSGGERQKIAIARALIRKPDILIFDEVTNHLDCESRLRMRSLLKQLRENTIVLMVSHDPEMLALCDNEIHLNVNGEQEE